MKFKSAMVEIVGLFLWSLLICKLRGVVLIMEWFITILIESGMAYIIILRQDLFEFVNYNENVVIAFFAFKLVVYILSFLYKNNKINEYLKSNKSFYEILKNENTFKIQRNYYIIVMALVAMNPALIKYLEQVNISYVRVFINYCLWAVSLILVIVASLNQARKRVVKGV